MSDLALRLIAKNKKTKAKSLDLGNCGLTEVPEEVLGCFWLEDLILSNSWWEYTFKDKKGIDRKSRNVGGKNSIEKLIPNLFHLSELKKLIINDSFISDLSPLSALQKLQILDCSGTEVSDLAPLSTLSNLQQLRCFGSKVSDLTPLSMLTNLKNLNCSNEKLTSLLPLSNLVNLKDISFSFSKVSDLSPLSGLTNLRKISCDYSHVKDLSPLINLVNLEMLSVGETEVSDLSPLLQLIKAGIQVKLRMQNEGIGVEGCPLTTPPTEIVQQGNEAILRYFEEKERQGEKPLLEAKIVVVGAGEAGKTTLIQKMKNPAHFVPNPADKRTEGVKVTPLPFKKQLDGMAVKAYLWDLGGQELYHATHQFFLSPDTFYILLNDNRKNDTNFYYWLNIIALRAGDECPLLCIFNKKENATRQISLDDSLFSVFPGLITLPEDLDFADPNAIRFEQLRETIEGHFLKLPVLRKKFPAYWVEVRNALEKINEPYISWRQFRTICEEAKITDEPQIKIVAQTLHNLGNLLWFPQIFGMQNLLILRPQWCLDAMYKVFDSEAVEKADGQFTKQHLAEMWSEEIYAEQMLSLEQLMRHFDLCYETEPNSGRFIAPQMLPLDAKPWTDFPQEGCIIFKHKYEFMPAGLMSRFIARMAQYICSDHVWRKGVVLRWDNDTIGEALEDPLAREITLRTSGPDRKRRMSEMRETLEILQNLFRGLKFQRLVSCNCTDCNNSAESTTFDLIELEDNAVYGDEMICRNGTRKRISAKRILEGFEYTDKPRIFISYSHKNEDYKNEFREMIAPLERKGEWKVWDDRYLLPGDEWNTEILKQLSEANVIVLLLTASFFNSDYINNIELTRAIERHEAGTALLIGVIVSDCLFEETPLNRIQLLPKDAIPVERQPNRSEVWKAVAQKIKEAIAKREERRQFKI